jgi:hypothetical protein
MKPRISITALRGLPRLRNLSTTRLRFLCPIPRFWARKYTSHANPSTLERDPLDVWHFCLFLSILTDTAEGRYHTHRFQPFC